MKREKYIHADFDKPPVALSPAPVSAAFPITWTVQDGDYQTLWADTLENLCHLTRMTWGTLRQNRRLGGIAHSIPVLSSKAISDLTAADLVTLVNRLREEADRARSAN